MTYLTNGAGAGSGLITLRTYCEAVDSAVMPANVADANGRTLTAGTQWTVTPISAGVFDLVLTVDVAAEVQAIVNRAGWASGNALSIVTKDDGTAGGNYVFTYLYENSPANVATIEVCYVEESTSSLSSSSMSSSSTSSVSSSSSSSTSSAVGLFPASAGSRRIGIASAGSQRLEFVTAGSVKLGPVSAGSQRYSG